MHHKERPPTMRYATDLLPARRRSTIDLMMQIGILAVMVASPTQVEGNCGQVLKSCFPGMSKIPCTGASEANVLLCSDALQVMDYATAPGDLVFRGTKMGP